MRMLLFMITVLPFPTLNPPCRRNNPTSQLFLLTSSFYVTVEAVLGNKDFAPPRHLPARNIARPDCSPHLMRAALLQPRLPRLSARHPFRYRRFASLRCEARQVPGGSA